MKYGRAVSIGLLGGLLLVVVVLVAGCSPAVYAENYCFGNPCFL